MANVFITGTRRADGTPRVTGIIDHERAFWGDPAAELVSLEICGPAGPGSDLAAGYAEGGGQLSFTPALRRRLALYRLYFGLILVVECGPRGCTPEHVARCRARLGNWATALITASASSSARSGRPFRQASNASAASPFSRQNSSGASVVLKPLGSLFSQASCWTDRISITLPSAAACCGRYMNKA